MQPIGIELVDNQTALAVTWQDGEISRLEATTLRRASRAASELRRLADGIELRLQSDLRVDAAEPIGSYALRLVFSDGHDRGIYPWVYLRELSFSHAA